MKLPNKETIAKGISRRAMLLGSAASAVAVSILPTHVFASSKGFSNKVATKLHYGTGNTTIAKHLCGSVHSQIAKKLDDIIADPAIDGERTALALMEARCPGCGERVEPETSSLSAAIPKWKPPDFKQTQIIS